MQTTDILLQMIYQTAWNLPNVPAAGNSSSQDSGVSFQDLLEQRRNQLDQTPDKDQTQDATQQQPVGEDTAPVETDDKPEQGTVLNMDLAAIGAALLAEGLPTQVQTPVPVEVAETPVAVAPLETVQPEVIPVVEQMVAQPETTPVVQQAVIQQPQEQTQQTVQQPVQAAETAPVQQTQVTATPQSQENSSTMEDAQSFTAAPRQDTEVDPEAVEVSGSWETPVFQETEHMPVKVGERVEIDTTAPASEVEAKLGNALTQALEDGSQRMEITLSPANLGTVTAEFTRSPEGVLHLVLRAENEHAAKLLSEHAGNLSLMLQDSTRGEVRVEVPQPHQGQQPWQQPDQNGGQQQQQQQQQERQVPKQEAESFLHQLRLGLLQSAPEAV